MEIKTMEIHEFTPKSPDILKTVNDFLKDIFFKDYSSVKIVIDKFLIKCIN